MLDELECLSLVYNGARQTKLLSIVGFDSKDQGSGNVTFLEFSQLVTVFGTVDCDVA